MAIATLDRRSRCDRDVSDLDVERFFTDHLPALAERHGHLVAAASDALGAPPLTIALDGRHWSIVADGRSVRAVRGPVEGALTLSFDPAQFSDFAQQLRTLNAMTVAGELRREGGRRRDASVWDSLWIALLEGWPVVDPDPGFVDRHGAPLDLHRPFTPDDDPADIAHFLREAGYLHLRGWLDPAAMAAISADIDRAEAHYQPDDGRSWWATLADGTERAVRLQHFLEHSPTTGELLSSGRWAEVRSAVAGTDELVQPPIEGNCIEALTKPLGVVRGISDVPWHRDCNFGRHAYRCASTTVGIAVTAGGPTSGQLRVVAGSHRLAMPVDLAYIDPYLPVVPLPTEVGDVTVHLSCTLHEAMPPTTTERQVMYTNFELPARVDDAPAASQPLSELRERAYKITSQPPSPVAGR